jgi:hypothetical protein
MINEDWIISNLGSRGDVIRNEHRQFAQSARFIRHRTDIRSPSGTTHYASAAEWWFTLDAPTS